MEKEGKTHINTKAETQTNTKWIMEEEVVEFSSPTPPTFLSHSSIRIKEKRKGKK